ncbi:MAG TPA: CoA-binding protein [Terriglobia bacterium]|nr:CoA-binding protein [Terriglobia bacterium]
MHLSVASHGSTILRERRRRRAWGFSMSDPIRTMLERSKTLAVVGLSSKPTRASNGVAAYMQAHGYRIIPVNPHETSVLGEKAYPHLEAVPEALDVVVVFRRSVHVPKIVETAIRLGVKAVWMQEGVKHEAAAQRARSAGLEVVQDRCILKEHAKRFAAGV